MSHRLLAPVLSIALFALAVPILAERAPLPEERADADVTFRRSPSFSGLEPGAFVAHKQIIPVDIVLIGFEANRDQPLGTRSTPAGHLDPGGALSAVLRAQRARRRARIPLQILADAQEPAVRRPLFPLPRQRRPTWQSHWFPGQSDRVHDRRTTTRRTTWSTSPGRSSISMGRASNAGSRTTPTLGRTATRSTSSTGTAVRTSRSTPIPEWATPIPTPAWTSAIFRAAS